MDAYQLQTISALTTRLLVAAGELSRAMGLYRSEPIYERPTPKEKSRHTGWALVPDLMVYTHTSGKWLTWRQVTPTGSAVWVLGTCEHNWNGHTCEFGQLTTLAVGFSSAKCVTTVPRAEWKAQSGVTEYQRLRPDLIVECVASLCRSCYDCYCCCFLPLPLSPLSPSLPPLSLVADTATSHH